MRKETRQAARTKTKALLALSSLCPYLPGDYHQIVQSAGWKWAEGVWRVNLCVEWGLIAWDGEKFQIGENAGWHGCPRRTKGETER